MSNNALFISWLVGWVFWCISLYIVLIVLVRRKNGTKKDVIIPFLEYVFVGLFWPIVVPVWLICDSLDRLTDYLLKR